LVVPQLLVVGSSTGGPNALTAMLMPIRETLQRLPVIVAQHMPPIFTALLAERIGKATGLPANEAEEGERLMPGHIYVAPGDRHLTIRKGETPSLSVTVAPPINFYRPSIDLLFQSASDAYGAGVLAAVLTGMGSDGREGARAIAARGGATLVQDGHSTVIGSMPGAVRSAGLASAEGSPEALAQIIDKLVRGERL
jgi:two-component system chemotaxis response regulator CheB